MGKNVPKLRFKGFEGEWEEKRLGDICTVITGNTPSTKESLNYGNEYLWASPGDLGNFKYIVNTKQKLSKLGFSKVRKIAKGSVLVTCIGSTIGKIGIASIDMSSNQQINSINCFYGAINEYIYYFLEYNFKKYMLYISFQAVPIINKSQFENFHIQIPDIKEQNKIVNFLSKVDRYIELQEKKVSELEKYKKGMMQKIFSQKIRFRKDDGGEYPEWEVKKIGQISKVITGNTPSTNDSENYGDKYLWASPGDLGNHKYILNTKQKLSDKGFSKSRKINKGSVLVTCIGSTIGKIGIAAEDMCSNQQINSLDGIEDIVNEYVYYFLEFNFKRYLSYISFQAVPIINKSQFEDFDIQVPCTLEQKKISKFLSKIDLLIETQNKKLDELKIWKKGLLQKMFV